MLWVMPLLGKRPHPNPGAKARYWKLEVLEAEGGTAKKVRAPGILYAH